MTRRGFFASLVHAAAVAMVAKRLTKPGAVVLGPGTYVLRRPLVLGDDSRLTGCNFIMEGDGMVHVVGKRVVLMGCYFQR
jgi:hypothetical protein